MLAPQVLSTWQAARSRRLSLPLLLGFGAVAAARLLALPHSLWEGDEVLFVKGIELFDPLHHQPHPPGYPLLIGLGKGLNLLLHDPFASLVTLSVLSSLIGYLALVDAFRRIVPAGPGTAERVAVAGAVLFHLSPAMLVYGPLALSDPPALMFLSLALAAAARLQESAGNEESGSLWPALALGAAASAAIGCRPQLALAVLPMLAVALWTARKRRATGSGVAALGAFAAFAAISLLWFVPLVKAVGGPAALLPFLARQAGLVARYDASAPRGGGRAAWVLVRFLAHPWGPRFMSVPVLGLAAAGMISLAFAKRSAVLPLAVLCGVDLAFALAVMNPWDAVRYALPSLLGIAFAAAVGGELLARRARVPAAVWPAVGLLAFGFVVYTQPFLATRTTALSPPVQAAGWVERSVPKGSVLLVDKEMAPYTSYLLRNWVLQPADPGLAAAGEWRPGTPVFLLAAAESGWPGAVVFRWPEGDAAAKLTREPCRIVSVSPIPPERRYRAVRGVGPYEPGIAQPAWRWLGPAAAIHLNAANAGGPSSSSVLTNTVALTFGLPTYAPRPSVLETVSVDGAAPRAVAVPRGGRRTLVLPLPGGAGPAEVTFGSAVSFVPAEVGLGGDRRQLAVQLLDVSRQAP
jgi:4-amino-4-deoxy-L-arabinose transferase-like glycosyltransferase